MDFDPTTMSRVTTEEFERIYLSLWGKGIAERMKEVPMNERIQKFAEQHPEGFTEEQFTETLTDETMLEGTRTLYDMALVSNKLDFNLETGVFSWPAISPVTS